MSDTAKAREEIIQLLVQLDELDRKVTAAVKEVEEEAGATVNELKAQAKALAKQHAISKAETDEYEMYWNEGKETIDKDGLKWLALAYPAINAVFNHGNPYPTIRRKRK
jgi:hypothetical protein